MHNYKVMISAEEISAKVAELGKKIEKDYEGKKLLVLAVLNGSFVFASDLIRSLQNMDVEIRFIRAKSYCGTETTGTVSVTRTDEISFENRNILIVEDIIDSGFTLKMLRDTLVQEKPESIKIASFLDKPSRRIVDIQPDYCCFSIPDKFVVGYGLDYNEKYRQLPFVAELTE